MDLSHRLRLLRCNLPMDSLNPLLERFASVGAIFDASSSQLADCGLNPQQIERIQQAREDEVARDLAWLEKPGHGILFQDSSNYPPQLLQIDNPPFALFYIGDPDYLSQPQLAMVGSRTPLPVAKKPPRTSPNTCHRRVSPLPVALPMALTPPATKAHSGASPVA